MYSGSELDALAQARNYYAWVLRQFAPFLGPSVVEVGAGIGTFSQFLLSVPRVRELTAKEPASNTFPVLERRFLGDARVRTLQGYLSDHYRTLSADAIVAVNVLEHVSDDRGFLRHARESVAVGGSLLLFVPALPSIFGTLDHAFEHQRRYTRATLRDTITSAGWKVHRISYMNVPGIAAWFLAGRVMRKTSIAVSEARAYDRLVIPWLSWLEERVKPPIGSNLLAIARKS